MFGKREIWYVGLFLIIAGGLYLFVKKISRNKRGRQHVYQEGFGPWTISHRLFTYIGEHLTPGKTILEFGSGWVSEQLARQYMVYSVEHDTAWVGRYDTNYIYVPLEGNWYNRFELKEKLPKQYDLILIDGPTTLRTDRNGFFENSALFKKEVPIIVDDVQTQEGRRLINALAKKWGRTYQIFQTEDDEVRFAVLFE